jgi:hypothetical protein
VKRKGIASTGFRAPKWEEWRYTPVVFLGVVNTGVTGCETWKSVKVDENMEVHGEG